MTIRLTCYILFSWMIIDDLVQGFAANCLMILLLNFIIGQKDERILQEFDEVVNEIKG